MEQLTFKSIISKNEDKLIENIMTNLLMNFGTYNIL